MKEAEENSAKIIEKNSTEESRNWLIIYINKKEQWV